jgi:hypothetical protein
MAFSIEEARKAKEKTKELLSQSSAVVGIGIIRVADGYGVKVNLETEAPGDLKLPASIDGVPIVVDVIGKIRKR